ncbi:MAG: replication-associated recombination protein A [Candidatus Firestonebacteria bacterium]
MVNTPLAKRLCPRDISEFVGQEHILGSGKLFRRAIESDRLSSIILYGPPGTGKNALARVIANKTSAHFIELNAVTAGVSDIRKVVDAAKNQINLLKQRTILFIDEIHRFNKLQQDALLPDVENGIIILIGATTQNPYFSINSALLSRSQIFQFESLKPENIKTILIRALDDKERGLGNYKVKIEDKALEFLINSSNGDARKSLNGLEIGVLTTLPDANGIINFTLAVAEESIQKKAIIYDSSEDSHYDTISAFIKSMRGSDPDAAIYWLAKMLHSGEDPRFVARRIVICAAEDVGLADPQALMLANAALQVSEVIGMPEARIPLAQATIYIACAPKSNSAYVAIDKALDDIEKKPILQVPKHLKDANYSGAKNFGHGIEYKYPHSYKEGYIKQQYIPEKRKYYEPQNRGYESKMKEYLEKLKKHESEFEKGN